MRATCILALAATFFSPRLAAQDAGWIELHGDVEPGAVRLAWTVTRWEEGVTGFVVQRRAPGSEGPWQRTHGGIIEPGIWLDKDLVNVEPDPAARAALQQKLRVAVSANRIKQVRPPEFFATVRRPPEHFFGALRRELFLDRDRPLLLGFGCVDRRVSAGLAYEYGLFPAQGRTVAETPAARFVTPALDRDDERLRVTRLRVIARELGTTLTWQFEEAKMRAWSIFGFRVYRAPAGSDRFELLTPLGVGSAETDGRMRTWTWVDKSAAPGARYRYRVVPFNYFQRELDAATAADFDPARAAALANVRLQLAVEQDAGTGHGVLTWNIEGLGDETLTRFAVERAALADATGGETAAFASLPDGTLPSAARRFVDTMPKTHQHAYAYRVTALLGGDVPVRSNTAVLVHLDLPTPPAPTGVRAEWLMLGDTPTIRFRWNPPAANDAITRGYLLYADIDAPGQLERQASVPETKVPQTEAFLPLHLLESRVLDVGVAAVGRAGQLSPVAQMRVFGPGRLPAPPANFVVRPANDAADDGVALAWEYPAGHDIAGFRIAANGAPAADESSLAAGVRTWRYTLPRPRGEYLFELTAVSLAGEPSPPQRAYFSAAAQSLPVKPLAPTDVRTGWLPDNRAIALTWATVDGADYAVAVDDTAIGEFGAPRIVAAAEAGRFVFAPENRERSYAFRLQTLGAAPAAEAPRPASITVETLCLAPGRTLPPARLDRVGITFDEAGRRQLTARWRYPAENVAGFRLHIDDTPLPGSPETDGTARVLSFALPATPGPHRYTIEALGPDGEISERGPAVVFVKR